MVRTRTRDTSNSVERVTVDREQAKALRRHKNRIAAQVSRDRRKRYVESLELRVKNAEQVIARLRKELERAQDEIATLGETLEVVVDERARLSPYLQGTATCDKCKERL